MRPRPRVRPAFHCPRPQRAVGDALADQADLGELDRLLGAGAVAVGALVLLAEGLLQAGDGGRSSGPSATGTVRSKDWPW